MDEAHAKKLLRDFKFPELFVEGLGWDQHKATLSIPIDNQTFELSAIAEKRGMAAFVCQCDDALPDYNLRRKIERQVAKSAHEHFIIFTDAAKTTQIWQWVKREPGKPAAAREHHFHREQPGDALIQKLKNVAFELAEEENLTLVDVTIRARTGFDVEKVTKRFYDRFQKEHAAFLKFIKGIPDEQLQRWYASVMLNRLMFIYFIQKRGFLSGDINYLRNKLEASKPTDKYYSGFLCPLFFEGFAKKSGERSPAVNELLGPVPYLNGGLFLRHHVEELHGKTIKIHDTAFECIFDFFEAYDWVLDPAHCEVGPPRRAARERKEEISPEILGYIFEKYINQKQMGAYYTKEDITEYISKNTVLPFLFDAARRKCKIAFENPNGPTIWDLLKPDPDRYIYDAVKKGVELPLPKEIEAGIKDVPKRRAWNKAAPAEFALPTEIWREVVARRQRYQEIRNKLGAGEVREINELITLNLNIRQFAQDVIENCEGPELLSAFWSAIQEVSILDPTCGSGAFLFAALNVLEPAYAACLDRMQAFVDEWSRANKNFHPNYERRFSEVLARVATHPNRVYFIFKSIILNNLFGVDIMDEAVEICKLRLFLKLAAQVEPDTTKENFGIEPLPDIDFNIRTGNTLVGYTTADEVKRSMQEFGSGQMRLGVEDELKSYARFCERVEDVDRQFKLFRDMQNEHGMDAKDFVKAKEALRERLKIVEDELNRYLASDYRVDSANKIAFERWLKAHQPFHWLLEFYGIMSKGGFDVIIGNPPYVEISDLEGSYNVRNLTLESTGNLYALCLERFVQIVRSGGAVGVIVPISAVSTPRMKALMELLTTELSPLFISNFAVRPGKLFVGVDMNLSIVIGTRSRSQGAIWSTKYNRWFEGTRRALFPTLQYARSKYFDDISAVPKIGDLQSHSLFERVSGVPRLSRIRKPSPPNEILFYHSGGRYFRKCLRERLSNEYKPLELLKGTANAVQCVLSSSFYYWLWIGVSDCYHVTSRDIDAVPLPDSILEDGEFAQLAEALEHDLWEHAEHRHRLRKDGSEQKEVNFRVGKSKHVIDQIDQRLERHYGFTAEELDFVMNYDQKFRFNMDDE